jgi:hypothetical protein
MSDGYEANWAGVQALFADHCDSCHPATNGVDLHVSVPDDVASGAGELVVSGDPEASALWRAVGGSSLSEMMPTSGRLAPQTVEHVRIWIQSGASIEAR